MTGIQHCFSIHNQVLSAKEQSISFQNEADASIKKERSVIGVYPHFLYQVFEGFGCALTESSCYLLAKMSPDKRRQALLDWFSKDGLDARFIRLHLDSCDFSLSMYQAVEDPIKDPDLATFSLQRDRQYILPVVKEAIELSDSPISVLLSPWSPPWQWKTPPELTENELEVYGQYRPDVDFRVPHRSVGGRLKKEYYLPWAKYIVRYIQEYLEEGIPVTMFSVNNEENAATPWDSCLWSGEEEREFVKDYLYPAFQDAGLADKVGIFIWDHNKERMIEHALVSITDETRKMIAGIAFHWYTGDHFEAISMIHEKWPEKILMSSECCTDWGQESPILVRESDLIAYAHDIIGNLQHGMQRWIDWNMVLDEKGGPRHTPGGCMASLIASENGIYTKTTVYETLRVISHTVHAGSIRIGSSSFSSEIEQTAVKNQNGSIGLLLLNKSPEENEVFIRIEGWIGSCKLPPCSLSGILIYK